MAQDDEKKYPPADKNVADMTRTELTLVAGNKNDPRQRAAQDELAARRIDPWHAIAARFAEDLPTREWMKNLTDRIIDASSMQAAIEKINQSPANREAIESANEAVADFSTTPAMQKSLDEINKSVADMLAESSVWQSFQQQQEQFYRDAFGPEEEPPESLGERTDEEFLRAAGFYMITFGQFESTLVQTMLVLSGQHKVKEVSIKNWWGTGKSLVEHLKQAIKHHDPAGDIAQDAQTLLDFYKTASAHRNHLMHGEMVMLPTKDKYQDRFLKGLDFPTYSVKPKKDQNRVDFEIKPVSAADFNEYSGELEMMYRLAHDLMDRLDPENERFEMWE